MIRGTLTIALLALLILPCHAAIIRVDLKGGGEHTTIQSGLDAASTGDTVLVMPGTYAGEGNRGLTLGTKNLVVVGADGPEQTIMDCEGLARGFVIDGNQTSATLIQGFAITNGAGDAGGAIEISNGSSPVVRECAFSLNDADHGGAISVDRECGATLDECSFTGNTASMMGGAIYISASWLVEIGSCAFAGNQADYGGSIYSSWCSPTITGCSFDGNWAEDAGGAVGFDLGSPTLIGCEFTGNAAYCGGALVAAGGAPTISECVFSLNEAEGYGYGGGALLNVSEEARVSDCVFEQNTSGYHGGGIYCARASSPVIASTSFIGNEAMHGGAVSIGELSATRIESCSFTGNAAQNTGAGVELVGTSAAIAGCTFTDNEAGIRGAGVYVAGGAPAVSDCLFHGNSADEGPAAAWSYSYGYDTAGTMSGCTVARNAAHSGGALYFRRSAPLVTRTIIAYTGPGSAASLGFDGGDPEITHCVIHGNADGDTLVGTHHDNLIADPLFCDFYSDDFTLCENSVCLPDNNAWGELIGALDAGCGNCDTPVAPVTWGRIKAIFR